MGSFTVFTGINKTGFLELEEHTTDPCSWKTAEVFCSPSD